jgi:DNA invertase Pin-like site-specific DNA recombinase
MGALAVVAAVALLILLVGGVLLVRRRTVRGRQQRQLGERLAAVVSTPSRPALSLQPPPPDKEPPPHHEPQAAPAPARAPIPASESPPPEPEPEPPPIRPAVEEQPVRANGHPAPGPGRSHDDEGDGDRPVHEGVPLGPQDGDGEVMMPPISARADEERSSPSEIGRAIGYSSVGREAGVQTKSGAQAEAIEAACERLGLEFVELVHDSEPRSGSDLKRPGLMYALERISVGDASCMIVPRLDRLARSASDLGSLMEWFQENKVRLVALDIDLDTASAEGQLAARALTTVGGLERQRLGERTKKGLEAARTKRRSSGRPAVSDRPALKERIAAMRADGMTLQAIANTLNEEGVPTLRGGSQWRPSSVQAAAGYKRPSRKNELTGLPALGRGDGSGEEAAGDAEPAA